MVSAISNLIVAFALLGCAYCKDEDITLISKLQKIVDQLNKIILKLETNTSTTGNTSTILPSQLSGIIFKNGLEN
jgi:hypothetical protein